MYVLFVFVTMYKIKYVTTFKEFNHNFACWLLLIAFFGLEFLVNIYYQKHEFLHLCIFLWIVHCNADREEYYLIRTSKFTIIIFN